MQPLEGLSMKALRLAFLALFAIAGASATARAEPVLLRVSLQDSIDNPLNQGLLAFKQEVEARTKGKVLVAIHDQSRFYNDYQVPAAVGSGAIEMGLAPLGQYAGEIPAAGVFLQPFLFDFDEIIRAAAQPGSEIRIIIDNEILSQTGARVLWWQRYGAPVMLSRSAPLPDPGMIGDRDIRAYDDLSADVIKQCGGTPHLIAQAKQASAFDLVEANLTDISSVRTQDLWRKTAYVTRMRMSEILYAVIINEDAWQGLSGEYRKIVLEAAAKVEKRIWDDFARIEADAYAFAVSKGMTIADLGVDDIMSWRICTSSILEAYMARAGQMGERLMAAYARLRAAPCCNKPAKVKTDAAVMR